MAGKTRTVSLSLTQEMYNQVEEFAEQMEISKSELLRRALDLFLASELKWQQIRKWGEETSEKLNIKDENDVGRIIHELRKEKSEYEANKKQRKKDMSIFDEIRKLNKGTDPEELDKDIQEAIKAARKKND